MFQKILGATFFLIFVLGAQEGRTTSWIPQTEWAKLLPAIQNAQTQLQKDMSVAMPAAMLWAQKLKQKCGSAYGCVQEHLDSVVTSCHNKCGKNPMAKPCQNLALQVEIYCEKLSGSNIDLYKQCYYVQMTLENCGAFFSCWVPCGAPIEALRSLS